MSQVETSRPTEDLTVTEEGKQESQPGSTEPTEESKEGEVSKQIAGFQKALQEAREREKEFKRKLDEIEKAKKRTEYERMDEATKWKTVAEENASIAQEKSMEVAKLKIQSLASRLLSNKKVPPGVERLIKESPWHLPELQEEITEDQTWDDIVELAQRKLPEIIDSYVADSGDQPTEEQSTKKVDTERGSGITIVKDRDYTREEIAKMDGKTYEKYREKVLDDLKRNKGTMPAR